MERMKNLRYQVILSMLMGIIVAYLFFFLVDSRSSQYTIISPLAEAKDIDHSITDRHPTIRIVPIKPLLRTTLNNIISKEKGTYSVVIRNLVTNEVVKINERTKMEPGSLYKLWVMATVMEKLEKGELTEDQLLSDSVVNINSAFKIDPESAELTEGIVSFTVNTALEQMITISHNYAALILAKKIRLASVDAFLSRYNFQDSLIGQPPQTTAEDISLFFDKLYKKELVTTERSIQMLDLLKRQKLNNKLPKYLPSGTIIAHKTGEIGTFSHDAGIVYSKNGPYSIVIFSDSGIPKEAEETIARLSQATYTYFEEK